MNNRPHAHVSTHAVACVGKYDIVATRRTVLSRLGVGWIMRSASLFAVAVGFVAVLLVAMPPSAYASITLVLDPASGCPGTMVRVFLPEDGTILVDGGPLKLLSEPEGLIADYQCASIASYQGGNGGLGTASYQATNDQQVAICNFRVSESASCGTYIVLLGYEEKPFGEAGFELLCACAVGGCVQPVNSFALLSPWLAILGLVGCIGTIVVVAKRRRA